MKIEESYSRYKGIRAVFFSFLTSFPSFRKTDRKNLLLAKSIANTFNSQYLFSKISSYRKIDRIYLHFVKSIANIFFRK